MSIYISIGFLIILAGTDGRWRNAPVVTSRLVPVTGIFIQRTPLCGRMPKITFIGAGGMVFATTLVGDVLSFDELEDSEIALMDIDEHRLEQTTRVAESMVDNADLDATVEATTDRVEALEGPTTCST